MAEIIPLNTPLERYSLMAVALLVVIACLTSSRQVIQEKTSKDTALLQAAGTKP